MGVRRCNGFSGLRVAGWVVVPAWAAWAAPAMRSLSLRTHAHLETGAQLCSSLECQPTPAGDSISSSWRRCRTILVLTLCQVAPYVTPACKIPP